MSSGVRYKFNGSTFQVQSGLGGSSPTPAISGITQADPAVVSSAAHPFVTGNVVKLSGVVGMTEVNGDLFAVDNEASGTFELAGYDSSGNTAYVSGGHIDLVTFSPFCELTGVNQQDGTSDEIDATTICSTAKEFELGLSDSGTLQLDYNFAPSEAVQAIIRAAKESGDQLAFKITLPGAGGTIIMIGAVQQQSFSAQVSDLWKGSATIKLSGPIFVV